MSDTYLMAGPMLLVLILWIIAKSDKIRRASGNI